MKLKFQMSVLILVHNWVPVRVVCILLLYLQLACSNAVVYIIGEKNEQPPARTVWRPLLTIPVRFLSAI